MHAELASRLGDVPLALLQDLLNVFPLESSDGTGSLGWADVGIAFVAVQGGDDLVCVNGLGQVVLCSELDGFDSCGNAGVARVPVPLC